MYLIVGWQRNFQTVPGKNADDGMIHCVTRKQAEFILDMLKEQMLKYGLNIHPEKSKIVFCRKNNQLIQKDVETPFVFLGYCFRTRLSKVNKMCILWVSRLLLVRMWHVHFERE